MEVELRANASQRLSPLPWPVAPHRPARPRHLAREPRAIREYRSSRLLRTPLAAEWLPTLPAA